MSILASLAKARDRLPDVPPYGFSAEKIGFLISLNSNGSMVHVTDMRNGSGKKKQPVQLLVPQPVKRTAYRAVERILRGSAELHTQYPGRPGCMGLNGALACSEATEPIRAELANRRAATQSALRQRLERARNEGDLPGAADCEALAALVMAITQGMAVQAKGGATRDMLDRLVDQALATWPVGTRSGRRADD